MRFSSGLSQPFPLSRRRFLCGFAGSLASYAFSRNALGQASPSMPVFEEVPPSVSGIRWTHNAAQSAQKYLPEATGPGCAFLDYDNDGWLDIYLVNSGQSDFFTPAQPLRNALYRNNRDGTFTDVTEKAGVGVQGWASHAVWFDYDNDGRLDLFVGQFAGFDKANGCGISSDGKRHYCIPRIFRPMPSWLFHNNGDGTFTDVSKESGIASSLGKAWGAVATDVNNDGKMDLFVANDTVGNFLFINRGDGRFEEAGLRADIAYSADGRSRSGMGVDYADFEKEGWMDLFVANIDQEIFSLYRNNHDATFDDQAMRLGIGMATRWMSGWGLKFIDYDNDGNLDLILANGFPDDLVEEFSNQVKYQEPLLLFHNTGGKYKNVSDESGPVFQKSFSARGLAVGDFNNDGGIDVLVAVNNGAPVLLRNNVGKENHWLGVKLVGTKSNRDAIGARLTYRAGDLTRSRMKTGGGSFLSSHDPRMLLGLGKRPKLDWLEVQWPQPGGGPERFTNLPTDRYITIMEGTGRWK